MKLEFNDRVVVVTGAAHGFGREIACRFAALGAHVHAWDIIPHEVEENRSAGTRLSVAFNFGPAQAED